MRQGAAHARAIGPTCEVSDPRANERAHARGEERRQLALGAVSHAIRLSELSTVSANVAIPTIQLRGATRCRGNCMRHSWITHREGVMHYHSHRRPPRTGGGGHEKSTPTGVLFINAEPPPVDRTEGGRCAPEGTRTPNLLNRNQMLYPLSYGRCAVWLGTSLHASRQDAKPNDMN